MEYILNGQILNGNGGTHAGNPVYQAVATGSVGNALLRAKGDPRVLRPYEEVNGRTYIDVANQLKGGKDHQVLTNSTATLLKDQWQVVDQVILEVAKERLRAVADFRSRGLVFNVPEGMGKTVLQYQAQSDITPAIIAMDPRTRSDGDRPVFDLLNLPLPIISKDFSFGIRELMESRNRPGFSLDTTTARLAAHRVAEEVEQLLIGTAGTYTYGGGTLYGFTNFPQRITKTMTSPTSGGWTGSTTVAEVVDMRTQAMLAKNYGPFMIYNSPLWESYLDLDYSAAKGENSLRDRILKVGSVLGLQTVDFLTNDTYPYQMIMVQMKPETARLVVAMDMVTVQWGEMNDMEQHFKIMCIIVPQLRYDHNGNTGIVHGKST